MTQAKACNTIENSQKQWPKSRNHQEYLNQRHVKDPRVGFSGSHTALAQAYELFQWEATGLQELHKLVVL